MKKNLLVIALSVFGLNSLAAEGNTISAGIGGGFTIPAIVVLDAYIYYDRDIIPEFLSLGVGAATHSYPLGIIAIAVNEDRFSAEGWKVEGRVRLYPWKGVFHLGLGVGYANYMKALSEPVISPALGWKVKIGSSNWVFDISLRSETFLGEGFKYANTDGNDKTLRPSNLMLGLAVGCTF